MSDNCLWLGTDVISPLPDIFWKGQESERSKVQQKSFSELEENPVKKLFRKCFITSILASTQNDTSLWKSKAIDYSQEIKDLFFQAKKAFNKNLMLLRLLFWIYFKVIISSFPKISNHNVTENNTVKAELKRIMQSHKKTRRVQKVHSLQETGLLNII